ncbi:MAG: hypothetical protein LBE60_16715 [Microbacterium sp.]|jgi:hypothetical protein|uniref:hypothetical protein n=1 Tax=Microbacterium sp. TaxID=51671 RepID=UPI002830299D|nr:hypothetical protein [Microbacterium sp.]MDR2323279.1 hypothetical protein [Microbacterium sp.]
MNAQHSIQLPEPECAFGYSERQLRDALGDRYDDFIEYVLMRANAICTGNSPCAVAHGNTFYQHDVQRFVERA